MTFIHIQTLKTYYSRDEIIKLGMNNKLIEKVTSKFS